MCDNYLTRRDRQALTDVLSNEGVFTIDIKDYNSGLPSVLLYLEELKNNFSINFAVCFFHLDEEYAERKYNLSSTQAQELHEVMIADSRDVENGNTTCILEKLKKAYAQLEPQYKDIANNSSFSFCLWGEDKKQITKNKLNEYIKKYEDNSLSGEEVYKYEKHMEVFISFLKKIEADFNLNHVEFIPFDLMDYYERKEHFKFWEFMLSLEKKNYVKIKTITELYTQEHDGFEYSGSYIEAPKEFDGYKFQLEILSKSKEVEALELGNWVTFANLSLRLDTGHVYNGNFIKVYKTTEPKYKLLCMLINEPEKKFNLNEIEEEVYADDNKSADAKQMTDRINDLVKGIRKDLSMRDESSKVNILGKDDYYLLTIIPHK